MELTNKRNMAVLKNMILSSNEYKEQRDYWIKKLEGTRYLSTFPYDYSQVSEDNFSEEVIRNNIDHETFTVLMKFCNYSEYAFNLLLLSCMNILLSAYTGQNEITVGSIFSTATESGKDLSTLILKNQIGQADTGKELLLQVKDTYGEAVKYKNIPIEILYDMIVGTDSALQEAYIKTFVTVNSRFSNHKKFDTLFAITTNENEALLEVHYNASLYNRSSIVRITENFNYILSGFVDHMGTVVSTLGILCNAERKLLLYEFNRTEVKYNKIQTIYELFQNQVTNTPDSVALVCDGLSYTYKELQMKSGSIANYLKRNGIVAGNIVGIMLDRTVEMVATLLGILRTGAAYLPLDPNYPDSRLQYMLEDSGAIAVVLQKPYGNKFTYAGIIIDVMEAIKEVEDENLTDMTQSSEELAYVIYTSGSTGTPKGVMLEHRSVYNFIEGISNVIDFTPGQKVLSLTTICFDIFVLELWVALAKGLTVVLANEEQQKDNHLIWDLIIRERINIIQATPSRIKLLISGTQGNEALKKLESIIVGGEAFPAKLYENLKSITNATIYNVYGPTETTVWSTVKKLDHGTITIGKPISNTRIYILNKENNMVPIGVSGELCIGGDGLARGYLNNPDLTAERFVKVPALDMERIYKTGDYARWKENGEIEYIGRNDSQVKVRGHRIELGELENCMNQFSEVQESAAVVKEDLSNNLIICAYIVTTKEIHMKVLKERLSETLPYYMIPTFIFRIEKMPYTLNGKIDRKALLNIKDMQEDIIDYVEPANNLEEVLTEIFMKVLESERISVNDDFFDIGGHSLNVIKVEIESEERGLSLTANDVYEYKTIRDIAQFLTKQMDADAIDQSLDQQEEIEANTILVLNEKLNISETSSVELIEGIEPYTKLFYRNCFYNSLFPVLQYYGVDIINFLIQEFTLYRTDTNSNQKLFELVFESYDEVISRVNKIGIDANTKKITHSIISDIQEAIKRGNPVIVKVDCYYESIRKDAFEKSHINHSWLVYGYNNITQSIYVIEHLFFEDTKYKKLEISYEDLVKCYNGYIESFNDDEHPSYYEIFYDKNTDSRHKSITSLTENYLTIHKDNYKAIYKGIQLFKQAAEDLYKLALDKEAYKSIEEELIHKLNNTINIKQVEMFKIRYLFDERDSRRIMAEEIIKELQKIRATLYKASLIKDENNSKIIKAIGNLGNVAEHEVHLLNKLTM